MGKATFRLEIVYIVLDAAEAGPTFQPCLTIGGNHGKQYFYVPTERISWFRPYL